MAAVAEPEYDTVGDDLDLMRPEDGPIIKVDVESPVRPPCGFPAPGRPAGAPPVLCRMSDFAPHEPHAKQRAFLMLAVLEAFYGGAAGGGKSDAMLMAALQFVDVPGYAALILRRTYKQLDQPGGLMDRAGNWLRPTAATWHEGRKRWTFPSGATLTFGYLASDLHLENYQGGEYQFIGADESTQLTPKQYRTMFSRLRQPTADTLAQYAGARSAKDGITLAGVPLRFRGGANPGGASHTFHKRRLVDAATRRPGVFFVPARLEDNPSLNAESYEQALRVMDPVNWRRFRFGDWETRDPGEIFDATKIRTVDEHGHDLRAWPGSEIDPRYERCRYWDLASSEVKAGTDPDWTTGFRLALDRDQGGFRIEHIVHFRAEPDRAEQIMRDVADRDGRYVAHVVEQEPGSEGKRYIAYVRRHLLAGYRVFRDRPTGPKELRIRQLQPTINEGDVSMVPGPYTAPFVDELDAWPNVDHDDQVDAMAGAYRWLTRGGQGQ